MRLWIGSKLNKVYISDGIWNIIKCWKELDMTTKVRPCTTGANTDNIFKLVIAMNW